jgi:hypothetical protein
MESYAVVWSEEQGALNIGRLELQPDGILLDGSVARELPYREMREVRVGRAGRERIAGRRTLLVQLVSGGIVAIASIGAPGTLSEVAEWLLPRVAV